MPEAVERAREIEGLIERGETGREGGLCVNGFVWCKLEEAETGLVREEAVDIPLERECANGEGCGGLG